MLKNLLQGRLSLPSLCAVCRCWNRYAVCDSCRNELGQVVSRCPSCALPLAPGLTLCVHCTEHGPSPIQRACARFDYQWPWTHWVQQWKFHQHSAWSAEWARLMLQDPVIAQTLKTSAVWIPIPLAPQRLSERGFNQAWELIKRLHPIAPHARLLPQALLHHPTQRLQHQLSRSQRWEHAHQALSFDPQYTGQIKGQRVVVVDDVMTTGATLSAAAEHLLKAGAMEVNSVALARTPQATTKLRSVSPKDEALLLS